VIDQALLLVALLALSSLGLWVARRRDGRFRPTGAPLASGDVPRLTPADLGSPLDHRATFVLLSSEACSTCPQVRRVLAAIAADEPDLDVRELAAQDHLDLVRRLDVLRTPTVLLLDATGRVRSRTSGPLRPEQARAALTDVLPTPARS